MYKLELTDIEMMALKCLVMQIENAKPDKISYICDSLCINHHQMKFLFEVKQKINIQYPINGK